jgi:hypothetical protein
MCSSLNSLVHVMVVDVLDQARIKDQEITEHNLLDIIADLYHFILDDVVVLRTYTGLCNRRKI